MECEYLFTLTTFLKLTTSVLWSEIKNPFRGLEDPGVKGTDLSSVKLPL